MARGALLQWTLSSLATRGTAMKKQNNQQNQKSTKEQQLFLKTRNGNIRSNGKQSTPKAEGGYCNEATQSGPFTQQSKPPRPEYSGTYGVKQRRTWTKEVIREVIWCYTYCRQYFTENYKKMYEIWRQRKPECRMYIDTKKLMNQENYIMKHKKVTEMEVEEIKRELQESHRSHPKERKEEKQEHLGTIRDDER